MRGVSVSEKREQGTQMPDELRAELIRRLRRIEGQAQGVQRMIAEGRDCHAVLDQLNSIRAAAYGACLVLIKEYALECVRRSGEEKVSEQAVDEMVEMMLRLRS